MKASEFMTYANVCLVTNTTAEKFPQVTNSNIWLTTYLTKPSHLPTLSLPYSDSRALFRGVIWGCFVAYGGKKRLVFFIKESLDF